MCRANRALGLVTGKETRTFAKTLAARTHESYLPGYRWRLPGKLLTCLLPHLRKERETLRFPGAVSKVSVSLAQPLTAVAAETRSAHC